MSIYQHPKSKYLWCRFEIGTQQVRRSTRTTDKVAAEEFESKLRADLWRQVRLGERPAYTWEQAVAKWYAETETRGREPDREKLKWFDQYLAGLPLRDINKELIEKMQLVRATESSKSTANRYMALLRMLLRRAEIDWEWIDRAPSVPMYSIEKAEPRFITRQQAAKLLKKMPPYMARMAEFTLETGLRMRNMTGLHWEPSPPDAPKAWPFVDLKRKLLIVPAASAKSGNTISAPLSARALAILKAIRADEPHKTHVFVYRDKPIDDCNGARFKKAAREEGIPWLRWHDLRHTWASWHIQAGTPPHVLQELAGWSTIAMAQRYGHLSVDHLRAFVEHRNGRALRKA